MPARLYYICCHTDVYHDIEIPVTYVLLLLSDDDVEITSVPLQCYQTWPITYFHDTRAAIIGHRPKDCTREPLRYWFGLRHQREVWQCLRSLRAAVARLPQYVGLLTSRWGNGSIRL